MILDRRQLALPALAIELLGIFPAFAASSDEEAVAKNVEAFRAAQFALDANALDALCAAELSYSHSDARIMDKATFLATSTNRKTKYSIADLPGSQDPCRRSCRDRAVHLGERKRIHRRR